MKEVFTIVRSDDGTVERIDWTEFDLRLLAMVLVATINAMYGHTDLVEIAASLIRAKPALSADLMTKVHLMGRGVWEDEAVTRNDERLKMITRILRIKQDVIDRAT